jgi:alkanesulfonate monooxygenase SsuD/methylene tetrahydromethanopterin reductase-like flavin-dependent oxidoreductase (luciferase family)
MPFQRGAGSVGARSVLSDHRPGTPSQLTIEQMKIGVQLPEVEREVGWLEIRDVALAVDQSGFDSIWLGDHLLYRDPDGEARGPWEAWSLLAGLAEATERVELGPLVAATSFHAPAMIAKKAATVDEISGGRFILGLGAGWNRTEFEAYGFPYDNRVSRFEEAFTIIRTLIREGAVEFDGRFYSNRDMELVPTARPDMKILIGSNGPRMLAHTVAHADMWNTWHLDYGNRAGGLRPLLELVDKVCLDVGRDTAEVERTAAVYIQLPRGSGRRAGSAEKQESEPISGSHEDIAEELAGFQRVGVSHIQIVLDPIDPNGVEELASIVSLL